MAGSKRQRELARRRAERQSARRREAMVRKRKRRLVVGGSGLGVLVLILAIFFVVRANRDDKKAPLAAATPTADAFTSKSPSNATSSTAASSTESSATESSSVSPAANGCTYTERGAPGKAGTPPATGFDKKPRVASVKFASGTVTIDMFSDKAPCTVSSFAHLASKKYFDGTKCHRLTTGGIFVLQCGDPTGTGSGGPGYEFADENLAGATYPAGTVAMANSGPGTNGSQFFLVYKDTELPPKYTPFGKIKSGLDIVENIAKAGTKDGGADGAPKDDILIESFTVAAS